MRKVILGLAISLDGLIEGPNGEYDWCFTDQDYGMNNFLKTIDTVLYGRKSYELMIKWEGGLDSFGKMKNYVFSNSLQEVQNAELVKGDAVSAVKKLKGQDGKNIWLFGGAELASSLINANQVDEIWMSVHPIVLGKGKPLFIGIQERKKMRLLDTRSYETGLVSLKYQFNV
jgi:dihydrofolate reductase